MSKSKVVLMAVGSSGGHIYPALAVAERLKSSGEDFKIHFVHSGSLVGKNIFSNLPYSVYEIPIGGLAKGQKLVRKIKTMFQLPMAFIQSLILIKKLKVQIVFGTGGSVTGPVLMAGVLMNCKTAIWEANSSLGLANRWLSPFVSQIFTVFSSLKGVSQKKQKVCAYPLRKKIVDRASQLLQTEQDNIFKVLVLGGSQGSVFLNQAVSQALEDHSWRKNIFIYHQTGEKSFESIKQKYKDLQGVEVFAFRHNIEEYYKKSDLVFSRAGAGAIWEVAFYSKALVLVPLTHSAGAHQLKNSLELSAKNCVEMIQERDFNANTFKEKLIELKQNNDRRKQLALSLKKACSGDGAEQIANWFCK